MPPDRLQDLDATDWSLIAIALAQWAGNPNDLETPCERHAYRLLERIADAHDRDPAPFTSQYRPPPDVWHGTDE